MDVIETARQLGKAIQQDERYKAYSKAKALNDADSSLQELIGDFNLKRQKLAMETSKPENEQDAEKVKQLNKQMHDSYDKVMSNENMAGYTVAKGEMDKLMDEINTILTFALQGDNPETCPSVLSGSCSGSCEGCGGCG